jgi:hypothetical protein
MKQDNNIMTIGELRAEIEHYPSDTKIIIVPSDDDREEMQLPMTKDMWARHRIPGGGYVAILCFQFSDVNL